LTPADSPAVITAPASVPACPAEDEGAYRHDGFFLRSAPGIAGFWAIVSGWSGEPSRTGVRGFGQSSVLELGGTPAPGLVLGGSVWTARFDPVFVEGGRRVSSDDDSVKLTQLRVGPFVDFYPWPKRGFHTLAAVSLVVEFESDTQGDAIKPVWYGASLATGTGYEWFIARELSLGVFARFAFGSLLRSSAGATEHLTFVAPELALTATYH
jgi:hypothetical protein